MMDDDRHEDNGKLFKVVGPTKNQGRIGKQVGHRQGAFDNQWRDLLFEDDEGGQQWIRDRWLEPVD